MPTRPKSRVKGGSIVPKLERRDMSHVVVVAAEVVIPNDRHDPSLQNSQPQYITDISVELRADGEIDSERDQQIGLKITFLYGTDSDAHQWGDLCVAEILTLRNVLNAALAEAERIGAIPSDLL